MSTRVVPSFALKGIDPHELLNDYMAGKFNRPIAPIETKLNVVNRAPMLAPTYGTSPHDPICSIKDRHNCDIIIATTNQRRFEVFHKDGETTPRDSPSRCDYCKDDFTHQAVGYPIAYEEKVLLTGDTYHNTYTFWVDGGFCSYQCALGYLQSMLSSNYKDNTLCDSERLLRLIHRFQYPNESVLRPAQHPALLKANGGSLTNEEWSDHKHVYVKTAGTVIIPAKAEYVRRTFVQA